MWCGLRAALLAGLILVACSSPSSRPAGPIAISLAAETAGSPAGVRVSGLSGTELSALGDAGWDEAAWQALLRVTIEGGAGIAVAGRHVASGDALIFEPRFPFDPGRSYTVRFDPSRLPVPRAAAVVETAVALPRRAPSAPTAVTAVSPSAEVWPANLVRFYVHFSAPMARGPGVDFVQLVDDRVREVPDALLPSPIDFWNEDRTRYTVFFEPGRVKRGILPNRTSGRALQPGRRYGIVVDAAWPDAEGRPLAAGYRRTFLAGPPIERALSLADWRLAAPRAGTTDPLVVTFPHPLDEGLLRRAIGVARTGDEAIAGTVGVAAGGRELRYVPAQAWRAGRHRLVVSSILEDPAGNRIGQAFEVEKAVSDRTPPVSERLRLPFLVGPGAAAPRQ